MDFASLLDTVLNGNAASNDLQQQPGQPDQSLDGLNGLDLFNPDLPAPHASSPERNIGIRRRRDLTDEEEEEYVAHLLLVAEDALDQHGVQGPTRNIVQKFAKLDTEEKLIQIMTVLAKRELEVAPTAAQTFIHSPAYSVHVVNLLKVAVLAPFLLSYITPLQEWILSDIQQHARAWQVPQEIIDESAQWFIFASTIKTKLTQLRSTYKGLLGKLAKEKADINKILKKLAPKQMVISEEHRARWAFIAQCHEQFDNVCLVGDMKSNEFWEYVEEQVAAVKLEVATRPGATTAAIRKRMVAGVFALVLANHRNNFPTQSGVGRLGERPAWQETLETSMALGAAV